MTTLRITGSCAFLVAALAAFTHVDVKKELLRVQIHSATGSVTSVRVHTRGLIILPKEPQGADLPSTVDTTMSTPIDLRLIGIGDADFEAVAPSAKLVLDATPIRQNAPPAQRCAAGHSM